MTITLAASDATPQVAGATTLTLNSTQGNLQCCFVVHRSATQTPTITGDGWSTAVLIETNIGNTNQRRAIAMFWRVVPAAQSTDITLSFSANPTRVAFGYEWATGTAGGTWSFDGANNNNSSGTSVTSLASNTVTPANNEAVVVDGLVTRNGDPAAEDSYSDSFTTGGSASSGAGVNELSGFSGYRIVDTTPAAMSTTASWTTSAMATSLIGAWSVSAATGDITGTLAVTQGDQTSAAAGQLGYSGSLAATQADQTVAAAGQLGSSGTLAVTQDDQTLSASGTVTGAGEITGSLAATQADQTAAAAGWIEVTGTVAVTQDDQTVNASGQLGSTGTLAVTQDDQTVTAAGWIAIFGTVAVTQADHTLTAAGFFGDIPVPAGHAATIPAGAHTATVDSGGHRVTVPRGTHSVEVH